MIEIVHRYTRSVLYRSEAAETVRVAVAEAVRSGATIEETLGRLKAMAAKVSP